MAKEIKFNIKLAIDGKEQLVTATTSTKELQRAIDGTRDAAKRMTDALLNLNQGVDAVRNMSDAFASLASTARQSMAVTQLTGDTGDAMRSLRSEVAAVAEYYGKDFAEVLRSANALAKGFGISARDAMGLVRSGFAAGADAGGDFLDTVREYPRYFREAGISAEAFVAITTNAARQGVFSDKGVDAIKEANIRLREMTPATQTALEGIGMSAEAVQQALRDGSATTFQIMQQVAARLRSLPGDASEVGAALADIFGGPGEDAGLEYIKTLADVELGMDAVKAATGGVAEAQDRQVAAIERVKNALTGIIDLSGLYNMAAPFITTAEKAGNAVVAVLALANALRGLDAASRLGQLWRLGTFLPQLVLNSGRGAAALRVLAGATRSSAAAALAAKVAIRGLLSATVIGAAVVALTVVVEKLAGAFADAGEAADDFSDKTMQAKAAQEQEAAEVNAARAALEQNIARLKNFCGSKEEELRLVRDMNSTYGETMGYYSTAAQWYTALTANSRAYCSQLVNEARMKRLAVGIADKETRMRGITRNSDGSARRYSKKRETEGYLGTELDPAGNTRLVPKKREIIGSSDLEKAQKAYDDLRKSVTAERKEMEDLAAASAKIKMQAFPGRSKKDPFAGTNTGGTNTGGKSNVQAAPAPAEGSMAYYERLISDARQRMERTADPAEARAALEDMQDARYGLHELKLRIGIEKPAEAVPIAKSINEELQAEIEPIDIQVRTNDLDKARERMGAATDAVARLGGSLASIGREIEVPALDVAGTIAAAIATTIMGFAEASAKEGKLGIWNWIAASAAGLANLTAVVGSIKAMGAFADGGVVSGPTLALVGEYAGAGSNPEVIAPLDKLRAMLNPAPGAVAGAVRFEIDGRKLVGVLSNETRTAAKSGRRSGIVI